MKKIDVIVADDSAFNRQLIKGILEETGRINVIALARNGQETIEKVLKYKPDILTLDLEMPVLDGFSVIRILMKVYPLPIVVVSSRSEADEVFKALELGAIDFVAKPTAKISRQLYDIKEALVKKILDVGNIDIWKKKREMASLGVKIATKELLASPKIKEKRQEQVKAKEPVKIIVIGASTGGPSSIRSILSNIPHGLDISILISQHMPPGFTEAFAERLNRYTSYAVKEAERGDKIYSGNVYVAPGGHHMLVRKRDDIPFIDIVSKYENDKYTPSIDALLKSSAVVFGKDTIAIILTGMGSDGFEGAISVKENQGTVIAESKESAVVYGMPKEITEKGIADMVLPLHQIPSSICKLLFK